MSLVEEDDLGVIAGGEDAVQIAEHIVAQIEFTEALAERRWVMWLSEQARWAFAKIKISRVLGEEEEEEEDSPLRVNSRRVFC